MRFNYSKNTLNQGVANQMRTQEVPSTFGSTNGAVEEPRSRMAGDRIADIKNAKGETKFREDMASWNQKFSMSNEGAAFNQAKMNGGQLQSEEESYYA